MARKSKMEEFERREREQEWEIISDTQYLMRFYFVSYEYGTHEAFIRTHTHTYIYMDQNISI